MKVVDLTLFLLAFSPSDAVFLKVLLSFPLFDMNALVVLSVSLVVKGHIFLLMTVQQTHLPCLSTENKSTMSILVSLALVKFYLPKKGCWKELQRDLYPKARYIITSASSWLIFWRGAVV